jgi:hypothetical protein
MYTVSQSVQICLQLWMQLLTPAFCHYISIIFSTNDQDLSWLITVFSQVLTSPKLIYVYINIFLFTILPLSFNLDLTPFFTWFSHLYFTFCKINNFNSVILSHLTILLMLFLHLCVIICDVIIVSILSVWLHFTYICTTFSSPLHRMHLNFYSLSFYALFSPFPVWTHVYAILFVILQLSISKWCEIWRL